MPTISDRFVKVLDLREGNEESFFLETCFEDGQSFLFSI